VIQNTDLRHAPVYTLVSEWNWRLGRLLRTQWVSLVGVNGRRRIASFMLALSLLAIPGLWGLPGANAARLSAPALWEPEYEGLRSPDPEVRAQTVKKLSVTQDPHAAPVLLLYLGDPDQKVGLYMAQALGDIAEEDALSALRLALKDPDPNIRWRAAMALGDHRDAKAVPGLAQLLQDPDKLVQNVAANALAQIGNREAAYALAAGLGSSEPSTVNNTMKGLLRLGPDAVPVLTLILESSNSQARRNSASLLGYIADPKAEAALRRKAASDPDADVRSEAEWALREVIKKQAK
jgi:HEAT repeat protein